MTRVNHFFLMFRKPFLAFVLLLVCHQVIARDEIRYQFALLKDVPREVQLSEILSDPSRYPFHSKPTVVSAGFVSQTSWAKLTLSTDTKAPFVMQFYYPGRRTVFYQDITQQWHSEHIDVASKPAGEFGRIHQTFTVRQELPSNPIIYIKSEHHGPHLYGHRLAPLERIQAIELVETLWWGGVLGILCVAIVIGLGLALWTRQTLYAYFALFALSVALRAIVSLQFGHLVDPLFYQQSNLMLRLNIINVLMMSSIIMFMKNYVNFKSFAPRLEHTLVLFVPASGLALLLDYWQVAKSMGITFISLTLFASAVVAVVGLIVGILKRNREAAVMAFSWIPGSSIALISIPVFYGYLPGTWFTEHIILLGAIFAVLMFSMALADQVYRLRSHRDWLLRTRNQKLEKQVNEQTQHLTEKNRKLAEQHNFLAKILSYKEELLTNIAHELKTPLTMMLGVLRGNYGEVERQQKLQRLVYRISHLLDSMIDLSKAKDIKNQKEGYHCYRANEFLEFYLTTYSGFVPEGRLVLNTNLPAIVYCARDTLDKVITNLINNAIKYSPAGSEIYVSATVEDQNWRFIIENSGKGIDTVHLDNIFERYIQVGEKQNSYGLGLGLPLVKQLLESAGGSIQIHSEKDAFTRVTAQLPLASEQQKAQSAHRGVNQDELSEEYLQWLYAELRELPTVNLSPDSVANETPKDETLPLVYCIDDNLELLEQFGEQLGGRFKVTCFDNPADALKVAEETLPDIIISDVMMPQMNGFDVLKYVRDNELLSHIPLILLTARADKESRKKGLLALADDYITKPYEIETLAFKIESLLEIRRLLKARFGVDAASDNSDPLTVSYQNCAPDQKLFMDKVVSCLKRHIQDPDFSIKELSEQLCLSSSQVRRKVKAICGYSPQEVLRIIRLEAAAAMIRDGEALKNIAHDCGFSSQSHMGTFFKAYFGVTPNQYRNGEPAK